MMSILYDDCAPHAACAVVDGALESQVLMTGWLPQPNQECYVSAQDVHNDAGPSESSEKKANWKE
jgi:hypothetical protein